MVGRYEGLYSGDVRALRPCKSRFIMLYSRLSDRLRVDPAERPAPKDLLNHPWIVANMSSHVNMARWLSEVWGWKYIKPEKARRSGHAS